MDNLQMTNNQNNSADKEKEWKGIKLTPIKEEEDGSNNYSEFKQKSVLDLDAAGYWQYVDGPYYNPPVIPELRSSQQVQGLDSTGAVVTITKAHAVIVKAVPVEKLYVVRDCKSAHDAWVALKNEYEPGNALTARSDSGDALYESTEVHVGSVRLELPLEVEEGGVEPMESFEDFEADFEASHLPVTCDVDSENLRAFISEDVTLSSEILRSPMMKAIQIS
ncbi:hypothetical protein B0H13DRAFT_2346760 [Mycena leptocephala]|nr:hypothetical protein B0H13DRAFT_2346760 [Mycena leptocephala]